MTQTRQREEPTAEHSYNVARAFVIRPDDLEKLDSLLESLGQAHYDAHCKDGRDRSFDGVAALLAYENLASREITSLTARASNYSTGQSSSVTVAFHGNRPLYGQNISVRISGRETVVDRFENGFEDRIAAMKPWYDPLARINFAWTFYWAIMFVSVAMGIGLTVAKWLHVYESANHRTATFGDIFTFAVVLLGTPIGVGVALNYVRDRLFPLGVFCIGQGERRHAGKEDLRRIVIVGIGISFVVSVVSGVLVAALLN